MYWELTACNLYNLTPKIYQLVSSSYMPPIPASPTIRIAIPNIL
ncbi:hypothetical protein CISG_10209 [Coccidioides immitis RMSCC 3703]|uniref:Uncharacterized protein n=1 Tax=Coccidioides immitis RMSCC 3703 TaxID=454286 RepID=A0A0J8QMK3_COCIT|nr:hypothetical protein CISG_10209 [Coccidioides immitis RMSCC 3703]